MSYATYDFTESLERASIAPADIASVEAAWGSGNENVDGYRWHTEGGGTEWSGGFLLRLNAGGYIYLTGWCDYTGWGCQDGIAVYRFAERPTHEQMVQAVKDTNEYDNAPPEAEWDIQPADLNRWLTAQV